MPSSINLVEAHLNRAGRMTGEPEPLSPSARRPTEPAERGSFPAKGIDMLVRARSIWLVASLMVLGASMAACSDDGGADTSDGTTTQAPATTPDATETQEPTPSDAGGEGIEVEAEDSSLGTILVDEEGRTLYVFLADTGPESTCYDECAATWPALTTDGEVDAGDGVTAALETSERTDGELQVTAAGRPLYHFASDTAPGDTNGQGLGDVWYVVSPAGKPIKK